MPNILALDTSGAACSVAVLHNGAITGQQVLAARSHTLKLLPMVDAVLSEAGAALGDLDAIAFGCGPGSFTGLRIACGVAQGLGFGADLPLVPVSSLAAVAAHIFSTNPEANNCLAAFDARMQQLYVGLFENNSGIPKLLDREQVIEPANYQLPPYEGSLYGAGSGFSYVAEMGIPDNVNTDSSVEVDARYLLPLAIQQFNLGETVAAEAAEPVYIRQQVSWQKQSA